MSVSADIIARLKDRCPQFRVIEGVAALSLAGDRPVASPAAFVVPVRQASGDNELATGGVRQQSEVEISVIVVAENAADGLLSAAAQDAEALVDAVRNALIGWQPPSAELPLEHVEGKLLKARAGAVWFDDSFATSVWISGDPS